MKQRVRAVLLTPTGTTLVMKRVRPGTDPYWVLIGGGIEDTDTTLEDGLLREIREEIAGTGEVIRPFAELTNDKGETEHFYLVSVTEWNFAARTGPEFDRDDRGEYHLEEVPLTTDAIKTLNLLPPQIKHLLADAIEAGNLLATA
ncbi:NUDIX domain-containing protein [Kitasatospora sp. NPDC051853]|uniref:NUDIX domain-containing protein n=1 Tax=Kitasatospora sp. NPDC051853 TaxID=3364058 RepID=UPI0037921240